jgi:hypothetical protein
VDVGRSWLEPEAVHTCVVFEMSRTEFFFREYVVYVFTFESFYCKLCGFDIPKYAEATRLQLNGDTADKAVM